MRTRSPRPSALALLAAAAVAAAACGRKEQAAPPPTSAPPPSAAPVTTAPTPTPVPTPPPVWREARWGMTRAEVLAAFPGAAASLPEPAGFSQPQPGSSLSGGQTDVAIPGHEEHGARFRVLFGFAGDALDRIQLSALKAGAHTCEEFEKALTQAHAAPAQRGRVGTSLRGEEMVWKKPDQTITLVCTGVPSLGFQTVTLDYAAPAGAAAVASGAGDR